MYISGLIDSKSELKCSSPESFPKREGCQFAFQFFEGSKEEAIGRQQKERLIVCHSKSADGLPFKL